MIKLKNIFPLHTSKKYNELYNLYQEIKFDYLCAEESVKSLYSACIELDLENEELKERLKEFIY